MPTTHPAPPASAPGVPIAGAAATARLQRLSLVIIAVHALLLAAAHWMLFEQFLDRAVSDLALPVAAAFKSFTVRSFGTEVLVLAAAAAAVAGARRAFAREASGRRVAAAGLLAYAPVAIHSFAVFVALVLGWEPDVWVMSSTDATDPEIAGAIQEALPIVLQPLVLGRHLATALAAVTFGVLQWRLCGISVRDSAIVAAVAGIAALAVQGFMLGVPQLD